MRDKRFVVGRFDEWHAWDNYNQFAGVSDVAYVQFCLETESILRDDGVPYRYVIGISTASMMTEAKAKEFVKRRDSERGWRVIDTHPMRGELTLKSFGL